MTISTTILIMTLCLPTLTTATTDLLLNGCVIAERRNWTVLKASGPTLRDYLQGQITQDITKLSDSCGIHSALLTPQGKAVSELYLLNSSDDELILLTPSSSAHATVARLRQFALGHTLRIGIVDAMGICSIQGTHVNSALELLGLNEPQASWLSYSHRDAVFAMVMPQLPRGYWIIAAKEIIEKLSDTLHVVDETEVEAMRIMRGIPHFGIEWDATMHPLNANLIEFNGISFDKGCYVGQEVSSRMHWRGGIKKRLYQVSIDGLPEAIPCPIRTTLNIGELKSAAMNHEGNCVGIALLPIATAESKNTLSLENGVRVTLLEACHA
ncbi:MAG: folate-binding protein [Mariprofundus sp.]|nr:folate-binding protein [Mariprofundus sp.]